MDERELVEKAKTNKEYFAKLYEAYFERIYSYIYYRTFNKQTTEDLTSETFFKVLKNIDRYKYKENVPFSSWIFKIAQNVVNDYYRKKKDCINIDDLQMIQSVKTPEEDFLEKVEKSKLKDALSKLTKDQQEVVILRYAADLKLTEIAKLKNKSDVAIRGLFFRAVHSLKEMLLKEVMDDER